MQEDTLDMINMHDGSILLCEIPSGMQVYLKSFMEENVQRKDLRMCCKYCGFRVSLHEFEDC